MKFLYGVILLCVQSACASAPSVAGTIFYTEDTVTNFNNPERGFYAYRPHDNLWGKHAVLRKQQNKTSMLTLHCVSSPSLNIPTLRTGLDSLRSNDVPRTLVFGRILADEYRDRPFDQVKMPGTS